MEWRMVARRAFDGSITIVGDLAQRSAGVVSSWSELLPSTFQEHQYRELTVNYRSPLELQALSEALLASIAPSIRPSSAIRSSDRPVQVRTVIDAVEEAAQVAAAAVARYGSERVAIIAPTSLVERIGDRCDVGTGAGLEILAPAQCKGLEFDTVILVEPGRMEREEGGLSAVYVAVTRPTQELMVITTEELPEAFQSADLPAPA